MAANVTIVGRLIKDAEYTEVSSDKGQGFLKLAIATDRPYGKKGDDGKYKRDSDIFNVDKWVNGDSGLINTLTKGYLISVNGHLEVDKFERDGNTIYKTVVKARDIDLLSKPRGQSDSSSGASNDSGSSKTEEDFGF